MSVTTLRQRLLTKLNAMQTLKGVWDWETSNPDAKHPYATVTLREGDANFRSTAHNLRRQGFTIRLRQEQTKTGQGPEAAEDILTAVLDEFEKAVDMDTTLSGACKYAQPAGWRADWETKDMITRILEIYIDAFELVSSA